MKPTLNLDFYQCTTLVVMNHGNRNGMHLAVWCPTYPGMHVRCRDGGFEHTFSMSLIQVVRVCVCFVCVTWVGV